MDQLIFEKDNELMKCDILFTLTDEQKGRKYFAYTDRTFDEEGRLKVYYSIYSRVENMLKVVDNINAIMWISELIIVLSAIVIGVWYLQEYADTFRDEEKDEVAKRGKKWIKPLLFILVSIMTVHIFIPTTKEALVIYGVVER